MSEPTHLVTVHVAIDSWSGPDCLSTVIGAWSTDDRAAFDAPAEILDFLRARLGDLFQPAAPAVIARMVELRRVEHAHWEQISLF